METDVQREKIPAQYRWDLSVLFPDDDAWEESYERYERRVSELSFDASDVESAESLLHALELRDELRHLDARLYYYTLGRSWEDVTDETAQGRLRRVQQLTDRRDSEFDRLETEIRAQGRPYIESLFTELPELNRYEQYLDDVFRQGEYALDPDVEAAVATLSESLDAPKRILEAMENRQFDPPTVTSPAGESRKLTRVAYRKEIQHPDREYRRRVYEAYRDALIENREIVTQSYLEHFRSKIARADLRGYDSAFTMAVDDLLPTGLIDTLVDGVRAHDGFGKRYERLRDRQEQDELRPWDMKAPLTEHDPEIPYDRATDLVVEALEPLGEDYQQRLEAFLTKRRVDVYPTDTKLDSHPAMACGADGTDAFVFLNYEDDLESLYFFIHELGHKMHYLQARDAQPRVHQRLPLKICELPSFLHEILLVQHLLANTDISNAAVLDSFLRKFPLPAAALGVSFVRDVEQALRAEHDVTPDDLEAMHLAANRAFREPISLEQADGTLWMNYLLSRDPYHPYLYLIGSTSALATARKLRNGTLSPEQYLDFQRAGDSQYPLELLEMLGLAVGSGAVVDTAGEEFERLIEQI